jgi:glyoxylase-like metal-dependent hydrolase (beta-lactamase superfamily II)
VGRLPAYSALEVAPGVYRLGDRLVNWWVIVRGDAATVVDAGLPGHFGQLVRLLQGLGLGPGSVRAVLVTHGHLDHFACVPAIRERGDVDVFLPQGDRDLAARRPRLDPTLVVRSLNPAGLRSAISYARRGALRASPLTDVIDLRDGDVVDAPGSPRFLGAPGHTPGGGMFLLERGDVLFTGDAFVTLDPFSGRTGPRTLPAFDNVDHAAALESLEKVRASGATILLPGHGDPWTGDPGEAVKTALAASGGRTGPSDAAER